MPVTKLLNTLFKGVSQVQQSAAKQAPKLEKSKAELPGAAGSVQSMSEPLRQNPAGLQAAPRIHEEDLTPLAKAFSCALQQYVDNKPEKHGDYMRGYCEMEELRGRITIDDQDKVRVVRLPRSPQKLADMFNLLLKGHSRFGSMYKSLTRPLEKRDNTLGAYLRFSHGKVSPAKTLPAGAVSTAKAEQAGKTQPQEIKTETVQQPAPAPEAPKPELKFTPGERNRISGGLNQILADYLLTGKKAASHQQKLKNQLESGDPVISRFLNVSNGEMKLTCPADRQELKGFLDALLSGHRGFDTRFAVGTSSLVNLVKKAVQSENGALHHYLKWESNNRLTTRAPDDEAMKAAELAEQQKRQALENKEKTALTKEIKAARDQQPALMTRVKLARHLQVHARANWPELEFRSIPATRMTSASLHGNESLVQLRDMAKAVNAENRNLAGELELNLEQLPTRSEVTEKGLPVTRSPVRQAMTELSEKVAGMEQKSSNWFTRLLFKPQHQALNEFKGRLNELNNLYQQLNEQWPGMADQAWFSSFVAREVEKLSDKLTAEQSFGPIRLTTPEYKTWQEVKADMLG